jgi:hypothetical protein
MLKFTNHQEETQKHTAAEPSLGRASQEGKNTSSLRDRGVKSSGIQASSKEVMDHQEKKMSIISQCLERTRKPTRYEKYEHLSQMSSF